MINQLQDQEETLGQFLASRARSASESRLAGDAIAAFLAGIAVLSWRGPAWDIRISIAACLLAFGVWGIADRDLARAESAPRPAFLLRPAFLFLRATRVAAAVLGFSAAAFLMLSLLGRAIGPIKS